MSNMSKQKKNLMGKLKRSMAWMAVVFTVIQMAVVNTYATTTAATTDVDTVTAPINNLVLLFEAIVGAVGLIMVVYNVSKLGPAISAHDNSAISQAIMGIAGGGIMAFVTTVLAFMGFR